MGAGGRIKKQRKAAKTDAVVDYRSYVWSAGELLMYGSMAICLTGIFAFLFYRSVLAMGMAFVVVPLFLRQRKAVCAGKRQERLMTQFCDGMQAVCAAMQAGYSVENAWMQGEKETKQLHGAASEMAREFAWMNGRLHVHVPMEQVVSAFAERTGLEDIQNFAVVFVYVRRNGGNMKAVIASTTDKIREKQEVLGEIRTMLASKKLEQKIMNVMPLGILFYITVTSPEYTQILYHSGFGRGLMSGCLAVYLAAWYWSGRLVDIEV